MRKLLLTVVASCALVAFVPATALAHGHHHARGHHARAHHKRFGTDWSQSGTTTSSGTGTTSAGDTAGTVQSFTGGVLTILLTNGSTVSGQVTGDTEIECGTPDMSGTSGTSGSSGSDGSSGWSGSSGSSGWQGHDHGGDNSSGNNGSGNDQSDDQGQGDDQSVQVSAQSCDSTSLTPTTVVREAMLSVSSNGAAWQKIELMTQPTTSSSSSPSTSTGS